MDVLGHQFIPNYMDSLAKGVDIGAKLARLPRDAAENAAQKAHAVLDKAYTQSIQKAAQAILKDPKYANDPQGQAEALRNLLVPSGSYYGEHGGGFSGAIPGQILPPGTFQSTIDATDRTNNPPKPGNVNNPGNTNNPQNSNNPQGNPVEDVINRNLPGTGYNINSGMGNPLLPVINRGNGNPATFQPLMPDQTTYFS